MNERRRHKSNRMGKLPHKSRRGTETQSPVVVCWPDGARYVVPASAYHAQGKFASPLQMYAPDGRRIWVN